MVFFGWAGFKQWILLGSDVFHELDKSFLALIYNGIAGGTRAKPKHTSYSRRGIDKSYVEKTHQERIYQVGNFR